MADKYVDTPRQNGLPARAHESSGVYLRFRTITFETAIADAAADVLRLFTVGAHECPVRCDILNDAISGATDIDLGLYRPVVGGAVVDADALMDGANISGGNAYGSHQDGLAALGLEELGGKSFFDIANDVATADVIGKLPQDGYDVAFTYNSNVAAAATITISLWTIDQQ